MRNRAIRRRVRELSHAVRYREKLTRGYYNVQLRTILCARGLPASALSSEFCTVQELEGPKNRSALRNSEVSSLGGV